MILQIDNQFIYKNSQKLGTKMTTFEHTTIKVFERTIKHEIEICSGKNKFKNTKVQ
jgi:hypothetical protein